MHVKPYNDMVVTLKYHALSVGLCIKVLGTYSKQSHYGSCTEQHQKKLSACQGKLISSLVVVARGGGVTVAQAGLEAVAIVVVVTDQSVNSHSVAGAKITFH